MANPIDPELIRGPSQDGMNPIEPMIAPADSNKPPGAGFKDVFRPPAKAGVAMGAKIGGPSPMDLAASRNIVAPQHATQQSVTAAMQTTQTNLVNVQNKLANAGPNLSTGNQLLVRQKLTNALGNIRQVATKVGVDPTKYPIKNMGGPFGKLLGMLTQGQRLLRSAREQVPNLYDKAGNVNPGAFLALQMKLSVAQLDIEFSSQALGKTSDALNKLMNINI